MAVAGRVAIVPKGDWSAAVEYKRLDAVAYNNTLYIAKKAVPAGTLPTDTEYWMKCVVGGAGSIATTEDAGIVKPDGDTITVDEDGTIHGAAVNVATTKEAGIVKAGDDINVDAAGEMSLKTDFTVQEELAELTGDEDRKTLFGKVAKLITDFIAHKALKATASVLGHVKISNSASITTEGEYALDAVEKNASVDGTLAYQIAQQNNNLETIGSHATSRISSNADVAIGTTTTVIYMDTSVSNTNEDIYEEADGGGILIKQPGTYLVRCRLHMLQGANDTISVQINRVNTSHIDCAEPKNIYPSTGIAQQLTVDFTTVLYNPSNIADRFYITTSCDKGISSVYGADTAPDSLISVTKIG